VIKITFVEPTDRKWKLWRSACEKATQDLREEVENGHKPSFSSLYRRKSIKKAVYFNKNGPFFGKCAYCECYITDFQRGDIEHFRPKAGVCNENDDPIMLKDENDNFVPHPGYFWLAYDWKNLLPSCTDCNQPITIDGNKIGKHNRFPVNGSYATSHEELPHETPLLINPVEEEPSLHLKIDTQTGTMGHSSERGRVCIDIFGLNIRTRLIEERLKACIEVKAKLAQMIWHPESREESMNALSEIKAGKRSYSMAARAVLKEMRFLFSMNRDDE